MMTFTMKCNSYSVQAMYENLAWEAGMVTHSKARMEESECLDKGPEKGQR